jgi:hypothetical protein
MDPNTREVAVLTGLPPAVYGAQVALPFTFGDAVGAEYWNTHAADSVTCAGRDSCLSSNDRTSSMMSELLSTFNPISLDEMKEVALLDRSEVKYTMNLSALLASLPDLRTAYRALEVNGRRLNRYRTLYFDTEDF